MLDPEALTRFINEVLRADRLRGRRVGLLSIRMLPPIDERVMSAVADRLLSEAREMDVVGRADGDKLILVAPGLREVDDLATLIVRIRGVFDRSLTIAGVEYPCPLEIAGSLANDRSSARSLMAAA